MASLPIDTTTGAWRQVRLYAQERIAELTADCINPSSTDEQRRNCAHRIDELNALLSAPGSALFETERRSTTAQRVY